MARRKRLDDRPIPAHPYRDSALVYAFLSVLLVVLAWLTGGDLARALPVAVVFFVVATSWSWWKFRGRVGQHEAAKSSPAPAGSDGEDSDGNGRGSPKQ